MQFASPKVEIQAKGKSNYTLQHIEDRLVVLAHVDTAEARQEIAYLKNLQQKIASRG